MSDTALAKLSAARALLTECRTVMEAKGVADAAEAARVYLERTNASVATVNQATEVRLLAERQMGVFLKTTPKNGGAKGVGKSAVKGVDRTQPRTLAQIGITKNESSQAQKLADVPEEEFKERIAVAQASGGKLTRSAVSRAPAEPPKPIVGAGDTHGHKVMRAIFAEVDRIRKTGVHVDKDMTLEVGAKIINAMPAPKAASTEKSADNPFGDRNEIPPSPELVTKYSASIGWPIDGNAFCDFYERKGWMVGRTKMKDWQAACRYAKREGYNFDKSSAAGRRTPEENPRDYTKF